MDVRADLCSQSALLGTRPHSHWRAGHASLQLVWLSTTLSPDVVVMMAVVMMVVMIMVMGREASLMLPQWR